MPNAATQALRFAIVRILRPLVRILLRNGVGCADFLELAKQAYVDVAMSDFQLPGRKPSVSRAAVITGLTRKDVQRLLRTAGTSADGDGHDGGYNRAARVVAGWVRDAEFQDSDAQPAELPLDGDAGSFAALVRRYSGDMPTRAVMDELARVGVVESTPTGRVRLLTRSFIPTSDDRHKLHILGTDVAALVETINHNLLADGRPPFYQRKARYNNLPAQAVAQLRPRLATECQQLVETADRLLAAHDRDTNPSSDGDGRLVAGIGIYYFEANYDPLVEEKEQ